MYQLYLNPQFRVLAAYKAATKAPRPIANPALPTQLLGIPAAPLSLIRALGVAVPFEMVPLLPGRKEEYVPLEAGVVWATSELLCEVAASVAEAGLVATSTADETSLSKAAERGVEEAGIGSVTEARVVYKSQLDSAVSVSKAPQSKLLVVDFSASSVL